eukprot:4088663-Pleurochrysis_carterae.AAC.2
MQPLTRTQIIKGASSQARSARAFQRASPQQTRASEPPALAWTCASALRRHPPDPKARAPKTRAASLIKSLAPSATPPPRRRRAACNCRRAPCAEVTSSAACSSAAPTCRPRRVQRLGMLYQVSQRTGEWERARRVVWPQRACSDRNAMLAACASVSWAASPPKALFTAPENETKSG